MNKLVCTVTLLMITIVSCKNKETIECDEKVFLNSLNNILLEFEHFRVGKRDAFVTISMEISNNNEIHLGFDSEVVDSYKKINFSESLNAESKKILYNDFFEDISEENIEEELKKLVFKKVSQLDKYHLNMIDCYTNDSSVNVFTLCSGRVAYFVFDKSTLNNEWLKRLDSCNELGGGWYITR